MNVASNAADGCLPPGAGFRFGVGSASGLRSSVYRIWTAKRSADVYIAAVPMAGTQKVSLHQTGNWQHSFLSQVAMKYVHRNSERHLEKWVRPKPITDGWTRGYCVTIPRTELRYYGSDGVGDVRWADDPGPGHWVSIEIMLAEANINSTLILDDAILLGSLALSSGGGVTLVARRYKPEPDAAQKLGAYREICLRDRELSDFQKAVQGPVVGLHGHQRDGTRGVTEVAMTLPPPSVRVICTGMPMPTPSRIVSKWRDGDLGGGHFELSVDRGTR